MKTVKASEISINEIKEGMRIELASGHRLEIMAIKGNYIMTRFKGAYPHVKHINELLDLLVNEQTI